MIVNLTEKESSFTKKAFACSPLAYLSLWAK